MTREEAEVALAAAGGGQARRQLEAAGVVGPLPASHDVPRRACGLWPEKQASSGRRAAAAPVAMALPAASIMARRNFGRATAWRRARFHGAERKKVAVCNNARVFALSFSLA